MDSRRGPRGLEGEARVSVDQVAQIETRVQRMKLADLRLLPLNARYMRHETFQTLISNLRRDGQLTSVPFACREDDGTYLVLSGNHRVQAAIAAGIDEADVMVTDDALDEQRRVAIQLSHNALAGEDDPAVLKELYDQLQDVDWRAYSGLDDKALELLEKVDVGQLSEANLDFATTTIVFLPHEAERLQAAWEAAQKEIAGAPDRVGLARLQEHERLLDALDAAGRSYDVTNIAASMLLLLEIFERHQDELTAGWLDENGELLEHKSSRAWVPLSTIFGGAEVPVEAAHVIREAVRKMQGAGEVGDRGAVFAIEMWAADYLAGR